VSGNTKSIETGLSIFSSCGGTWMVKGSDDEKIFVCPMCGTQKPILEDSSML